MNLLRSIALLALASLALAASAQVVRYEAPGSTFAPTVVAPNASADSLNSPGGLQAGNAVPNSVYFAPGVGTEAEAIAQSRYFQFTVSPSAGFALSLTSLTFDAAMGGENSPSGYAVRSSLDGFASNLGSGLFATVRPTFAPYSVALSGASASAVTFRVYSYLNPPEDGRGTFFDNITVNGSVQAVPEPATVAALGLGAVAMLRRRKRA